MKIQFITMLLAGILSGCSSVNSYHEPSNKPNIATISGSGPISGLNSPESTENTVKLIDNKEIGIVWSYSSKTNLTNGKHTIVGSVYYAPETVACCKTLTYSCSAYAEIPLTLDVKEGENYRFMSQPMDKSCNQVKGWIVNKNGNIVSVMKIVDFNLTYIRYTI